jgi:hypothetical protein
MISLSTAKLLLFIALLIGPKLGNSDHTIEIVNKSSYCVWTQDGSGWALTQLGQPINHWPLNGTNSSLDVQQLHNTDFVLAKEISRHNWNAEYAILNMPNGDIVEKQHNKIFYTINAGAANEQIYTIVTIKDGKTL